jgi:hypothetical protein
MATIAKLDRNGIEVVPEGQKVMGAGDSPLVDSSTGLDEGAGPSHMSLPQPASMLIGGKDFILKPKGRHFLSRMLQCLSYVIDIDCIKAYPNAF